MRGHMNIKLFYLFLFVLFITKTKRRIKHEISYSEHFPNIPRTLFLLIE